MYGYVQVYRPDLRFREYEVYRSLLRAMSYVTATL